VELEAVLFQLWRLWRWVLPGVLIASLAALAVVYHVGLLPPSLKAKSLEYASATTQIAVDSPSSSLAIFNEDVNPLTTRANIYSRFMTSPDVLDMIGHEAGIPPAWITAKGPFNLHQPRAIQEPTGERRADQVVGEVGRYRLRFETEETVPIVTIFAQAPTLREAFALANGAARGLRDWLRDFQELHDVTGPGRVEIRPLGNARGGVVNGGLGLKIGVLTFLGAFILWCLLVLFAARVAETFREGALGGNPPLELSDDGLLRDQGARTFTVANSHSGTPTPFDSALARHDR